MEHFFEPMKRYHRYDASVCVLLELDSDVPGRLSNIDFMLLQKCGGQCDGIGVVLKMIVAVRDPAEIRPRQARNDRPCEVNLPVLGYSGFVQFQLTALLSEEEASLGIGQRFLDDR
jgi:hypothetical protein